MASSPPPPDNTPPIHVMDNSGRGPLRVPGFGDIPVNYELPADARFAHGFGEWHQSLLLTAQELAMVAVMNWLTDKPAWFDDVFDDAIVAQWREEMDRDLERIVANSMLVNPRLMKGDKTWDWCVEELRDKAADFKKNHYIRVLDTGTCVCKVDSAELKPPSATLRRAFDLLALEFMGQQRLHADNPKPPTALKATTRTTEEDRDNRVAHAPTATDESGDSDPPWLETYYRKWAHADRERTTSAHMISAIVDPKLFTLVYGRTKVLQQGGTVDLDNVLASFGAAQVAPPAPRPMASQPKDDSDVSSLSEDDGYMSYIPSYNPWNQRYQSLPCEVIFAQAGDGKADSADEASVSVTITSYINGLHPYHADVYRAIEQILSCAIRPWNDCLIRGHRDMHESSLVAQLGPVPARIVTFGAEWENEMPDWTTAFRIRPEKSSQYFLEEYEKLRRLTQDDIPEWASRPEDISRWHADRHAKLRFLEELIANPGAKGLPAHDSDLWQRAKEYLEQPEPPSNDKALPGDDWAIGDERTWDLLCKKAERLVSFKHPEPGTAFSYREWKEGSHGDRPIIPPVQETSYDRLGSPHVGFSVALQDCFREKGLQVLVGINGIELTPEMPAYGQGIADREAVNSQKAAKEYAQARANEYLDMDMLACDDEDWLSGGLQLNDHIVAVATLAFDVDNIMEPRLEFRQAVSRCSLLHRCDECDPPEHAPDGYYYRDDGPAHLMGKDYDSGVLGEIFGLPQGHFDTDLWSNNSQQIGSVALPEGRLVTFPDVLQHRIRPFRLVDATRPGRLRWLTLCLVDPHYRVCSTRNVPPQQHAWWAREAGAVLRRAGGLPQELVDQILAYTDDWPMGMDEARKHREQMVEEGRLAERYYEWP